MGTQCNHCEGTGFVNADQIPEGLLDQGTEAVLEWLHERQQRLDYLGGCSCHINPPCSFCVDSHDVAVCDCCGDGEGWYGTPGEHYTSEDPPGDYGPYANNGGLCKCH